MKVSVLIHGEQGAPIVTQSRSGHTILDSLECIMKDNRLVGGTFKHSQGCQVGGIGRQ